MSTPLTLMAVHAHPDDESSSTGGVLARYADAGVRTVVVTCTNGELGDAPGRIKPGDEGHDEAEVARIRLGELERACETLGVAHLEMLGYHDSGMIDWDHKDRPDVFCNVAVDDAAERLSGLFERYQPDVVVTYDELGGYDHPDHVHASRVAMAAVARTGIPRKAYFTAFRRSMFERFRAVLEEHGADLSQIPQPDAQQLRMMDAVEARITTAIDVGPFVDRKRAALATHASQIDDSFWGRLPAEAFGALFALPTRLASIQRDGAGSAGVAPSLRYGEPFKRNGDRPEDDGSSRADHSVAGAWTAVGGGKKEAAEEHGGQAEQERSESVIGRVRGAPRPCEVPGGENCGGQSEQGCDRGAEAARAHDGDRGQAGRCGECDAQHVSPVRLSM